MAQAEQLAIAQGERLEGAPKACALVASSCATGPGAFSKSSMSGASSSAPGPLAEIERVRPRLGSRRNEKQVLRRMRWNQGRKGSPSRKVSRAL